MRFSAFAGFGAWKFSSKPTHGENIYNAMVAAKQGAFDMSVGSYEECKTYAQAMGLARARYTVDRARNQTDPLKAVELLPQLEKDWGVVPSETDTLVVRQQAVAARMALVRGSRREALETALRGIFGTDFLELRATLPGEAVTDMAAGIANYAAPAAPYKVIKLTDPVVTIGAVLVDTFSEANQNTQFNIAQSGGGLVSGTGESFLGNGSTLATAVFYLKKGGSPTGSAVAKVYASGGTFGSSDLPTGTALATSAPLDVSTLTTSFTLQTFTFSGPSQIALAAGTAYVVTIEYSSGLNGVNYVAVGMASSSTFHGHRSYLADAWTTVPLADTSAVCFYVNAALRVGYSNVDSTQPAVRVAAGDVFVIEPNSTAQREIVTVASATATTLSAVFTKSHDQNAIATTQNWVGWSSTQRRLYIVVKAASASNADRVRQANDFMARAVRGTTTWHVVQPTTPGATTMGPFTLNVSPLGLVPLGSMNL